MTVERVTNGLSDTLHEQVKQRSKRMSRSIDDTRSMTQSAISAALRQAIAGQFQHRCCYRFLQEYLT